MSRCPLAFILAFAVTTAASAQDAVPFRYKYSTKTPLIYKSTSDVEQTQTVMGKDHKNVFKTMEINQYRLVRVASDKSFNLERENKGLLIQINIGQLGEYKFDSKADSNEKGSTLGDALTPVYESLYGAVIKINQQRDGSIVSVKGIEQLLGQVLKNNEIARQFVGGGTNAGTKAGLQMVFPVFSKKPVKVGDTWTSAIEMEIPRIGKATGKRSYKFVETVSQNGRKLAKISCVLTMTVKVDLKMGDAKVTGETKVEKSQGTILFDAAKGQVVSMTDKYTVVGDLIVAANGKDIAVKTKQNQTGKLELLEKVPQ